MQPGLVCYQSFRSSAPLVTQLEPASGGSGKGHNWLPVSAFSVFSLTHQSHTGIHYPSRFAQYTCCHATELPSPGFSSKTWAHLPVRAVFKSPPAEAPPNTLPNTLPWGLFQNGTLFHSSQLVLSACYLQVLL